MLRTERPSTTLADQSAAAEQRSTIATVSQVHEMWRTRTGLGFTKRRSN